MVAVVINVRCKYLQRGFDYFSRSCNSLHNLLSPCAPIVPAPISKIAPPRGVNSNGARARCVQFGHEFNGFLRPRLARIASKIMQPRNAFNWRFKRAVKFGDNHLIGGFKSGAEQVSHLLRARKAVRLKNGGNRTLQPIARAIQSACDFGRMVRVIFVNQHVIGFAHALETARDTLQNLPSRAPIRSLRSRRNIAPFVVTGCRYALQIARAQRGERVAEIVHSRHLKRKPPDFIAARAQRVFEVFPLPETTFCALKCVFSSVEGFADFVNSIKQRPAIGVQAIWHFGIVGIKDRFKSRCRRTARTRATTGWPNRRSSPNARPQHWSRPQRWLHTA